MGPFGHPGITILSASMSITKRMAQQAANRALQTRVFDEREVPSHAAPLLRSLTGKRPEMVSLRAMLQEGPEKHPTSGRGGIISRLRRVLNTRAESDAFDQADIVNVAPSREVYIRARQSLEASAGRFQMRDLEL